MNKLVIATHNVKKGGEMVTILATAFPSLQICTLAEYPNAPEPEETGDTYAANATIKAESACAVTGLPSLADDAGLEIDFLDGAPGLYSKRFGGEDTPFPAKIEKILDLMREVPTEKRTARFRCYIALAIPGHPTRTIEDTCEGIIHTAPSGNGGFGYDPIFWLPDQNCTMADLTADQKHQISHRGKVLRRFSKLWESLYNN